jgi:L-threonylcarbamoyladenylate synthase
VSREPGKGAVFRVGKGRVPAGVLKETVRVLQQGGLAVFPTDTVYGLGASVFRPAAIRRIYKLKGRSYKKPLPLLVADRRQAEPLVEPLSPRLRRLLDDHWPGPLTVVFNTSDLGKIATGGKETVAVRVPDHAGARALLRAFGAPLAVTSANPSGRPAAATGAAARRTFEGRVEVLWDGGRCPVGVASTVLDASGLQWTLVREGALKKKTLLKYLDL